MFGATLTDVGRDVAGQKIDQTQGLQRAYACYKAERRAAERSETDEGIPLFTVIRELVRGGFTEEEATATIEHGIRSGELRCNKYWEIIPPVDADRK